MNTAATIPAPSPTLPSQRDVSTSPQHLATVLRGLKSEQDDSKVAYDACKASLLACWSGEESLDGITYVGASESATTDSAKLKAQLMRARTELAKLIKSEDDPKRVKRLANVMQQCEVPTKLSSRKATVRVRGSK